MSDITLTHTSTANHYSYHTDIINDLNNTNTSPSFEYTPYPAYNTFQTMGFVPSYQYSRPKSPESISSVTSPSTPPNQVLSQVVDTELITTPIVPSSTDRVKDMITRANSVPMEFYHTEFLEYSKETYEKKVNSKRKRSPQQPNNYSYKKSKVDTFSDEDFEDDDYQDAATMSSAEVRRQIHIQSEQKRRAQIKDGFDELRKHLPGCNNKKMSKAALLTRTVQQLQHLKGVQTDLLSEIERLLQENESLKKFQQSVLQRQAMEKMYTF